MLPVYLRDCVLTPAAEKHQPNTASNNVRIFVLGCVCESKSDRQMQPEVIWREKKNRCSV